MNDLDQRLIELGIEPLRQKKFHPFSEKQVIKFEKIIGASLPQDYRHFLLTFGSSVLFVDVHIKLPVEDTPPILRFGSFDSLEELASVFGVKEEVLPQGIIPFGRDGLDNFFCIGVNEKEFDHIFFHNHNFGWESEADEYESRGEPFPPDIRYVTVEKIANSFAEFVGNMEFNEDY